MPTPIQRPPVGKGKSAMNAEKTEAGSVAVDAAEDKKEEN
jgi:hypothetical protein